MARRITGIVPLAMRKNRHVLPRINADLRGYRSDHGDHPITRDHGDQ